MLQESVAGLFQLLGTCILFSTGHQYHEHKQQNQSPEQSTEVYLSSWIPRQIAFWNRGDIICHGFVFSFPFISDFSFLYLFCFHLFSFVYLFCLSILFLFVYLFRLSFYLFCRAMSLGIGHILP